jgi:hypothetical protein
VFDGLAAGALIDAALAPRPYRQEPVDYGPRRYIRRERIRDGWTWRVRHVEDSN